MTEIMYKTDFGESEGDRMFTEESPKNDRQPTETIPPVEVSDKKRRCRFTTTKKSPSFLILLR